MRISLSILLLSLLFICSSASLTCYDIIKKLSSLDKCLSSRFSYKSYIASTVNFSKDFVKSLNLTSFKCNGTSFACGLTMSWVTEVFEGISVQFTEYKYFDPFNGMIAGYTTEYDPFMAMMKKLPYHIIFQMRHTGAHDHVFTIEQLPNKEGYRVYQSYKDVYSLKAWLSSNLTGIFERNNGEIMLPTATQSLIDGRIREMTNNKSSLQNLTGLPSMFQPFLPFLQYIRDINETLVTKRFKKAWETYGQGKIMSYNDFWNVYMKKLNTIISYFKANDSSTNPFPQEIYDTWIELFGAADNTVFPGLPANAISSLVGPGKAYRFEVLGRILVDANENDACLKNAKLLVGKDFDFSEDGNNTKKQN